MDLSPTEDSSKVTVKIEIDIDDTEYNGIGKSTTLDKTDHNDDQEANSNIHSIKAIYMLQHDLKSTEETNLVNEDVHSMKNDTIDCSDVTSSKVPTVNNMIQQSKPWQPSMDISTENTKNGYSKFNKKKKVTLSNFLSKTTGRIKNSKSKLKSLKNTKVLEKKGRKKVVKGVNIPEVSNGESESLLNKDEVIKPPSLSEGESGDYQCSVCKKTFSSHYTRRCHMKTVHEENNIVEKEKLTDGSKTQAKKIKVVDCICSLCHKVFSTCYTLARHYYTIHNIDDNLEEIRATCEICKEQFANKYSLQRHKIRRHRPDIVQPKIEPRMYLCKQEGCGKVFANSSNCKKHYEAIHLNIRKHLCEICSFMFKTRGALRAHFNTCHEKDPLKSHIHMCTVCEKRFTSKGKLRIHETVHTNKKPFPCTFEGCGKSFRLKHNLSKHANVHLNIKPYVCQTCGQGFTRQMYLDTHQYKHTGVKMYKCSVCYKTFSQQGNLNIHMKTHGEEYCPHVCEICDKSYTTLSGLVKHKLSHTKTPSLNEGEDAQTKIIESI